MAGPVSAGPTTVSKGSLRQPWKTVALISNQTGKVVKPVDPAIGKILDVIYAIYSGTKKQLSKLPRIPPFILIILGLGFLAFASFIVAVPALIFFPVTIFFGIVTSIAAVVLAPLAFLFGWLLISSPSVQSKIIVPLVDKLGENKKIGKLLYEE